jgi:hypothetical protein
VKAWLASLELRQRILIALIAIDHLVLVVITLGNCYRGETISASAWRQEQAGRLQGRIFRPLIDALFYFIEKDHCSQSWLAEKHMYRRPV